jgi:hypothetical protein
MKLPPTILMGDVVGSRTLESQSVQRSLSNAVEAINAQFSSPKNSKKASRSQILSPLTITLGDEFQGVVSDLAAAVQILFAFEEYRIRGSLPFRLHFVTYVGPIDTELNREIAYGMLGPGLTHARALLTKKGRGRSQFVFESLLPDDDAHTQHGGSLPLSKGDLKFKKRGATEDLFVNKSSIYTKPEAGDKVLKLQPADYRLNEETVTSGAPLAFPWLRFQMRQLTGVFAMLETLTSHWRQKDFELIASMIEHPDDDGRVGEIHGKNRSQIWKRRKTLRIDDYFTLKGLATEIAAPTMP